MISLMLILGAHFLSDFVCQTHEMSIKKSKSLLWLSYHVLVYTSVTTLCWSLFFGYKMNDLITTIPMIFIATFISHWITDYFTSKWTSRLWAEEKVHDFFVVIGLDQLIHAITLIITFNYLIETI